MITLHKLLPVLVSPLFLLVGIAMVALVSRRRVLGFVALMLLWLLSLPVVSDPMWRMLEQQTVRRSVENVQTAQAIVVLSGMARTIQSDQGLVNEWAEASDRFWAGLELYKAGKAPGLIFTGGKLPWEKATQTEGEWLSEQALSLGIPKSAITLTSGVQNTADEARTVANLLPGAAVILVTSAFHMPRSRALFEAQGIAVQPYPVDFQVSERNTTLMDFLPSADALATSSAALREWLGRFYYWLKRPQSN
jgi:uncharacterized SAM-binding protein YcdF (DUF218 family)